jgi:hypothetical protein
LVAQEDSSVLIKKAAPGSKILEPGRQCNLLPIKAVELPTSKYPTGLALFAFVNV